jgi:hypothetical protein
MMLRLEPTVVRSTQALEWATLDHLQPPSDRCFPLLSAKMVPHRQIKNRNIRNTPFLG